MRRTRRLLAFIVLLVAALALASGAATAQTGGPYDLSWGCAGCSGGVVSGGSYTLFGSIGTLATDVPMTGGSYTVIGGFLALGSDSVVFVPLTVAGQ